MMEPVAWAYKFKGKSPVLTDEKKDWAVGSSKWTEEPLVRLSDAEARIAELEAENAFTLSDGSRMLQKSDVQGFCPNPDDCFYYGDRVRCGPCAVKASAAKGIAIDDTHSHLPEVCRLRRELKAAEARATAAEALLKEVGKVLEPFAFRRHETRNTHLLDWLPEGYWHCKRGSEDWAQSYLNSAKGYIQAFESAARAIHDKIGVAP